MGGQSVRIHIVGFCWDSLKHGASHHPFPIRQASASRILCRVVFAKVRRRDTASASGRVQMASIVESAPNVSWLDEELRKEKAIIQELRDLVDKQQVALVDQTQRALALENRLVKLEAQLSRIPEIHETVEHTRDEIVLMLSEVREEQQKRETEHLRGHQTEHEKTSRSIQELQVELKRFGPLEQAMPVRRAEEQRINESLWRTQQALEVVSKQVVRWEDTRRQLGDAIDKNAVAVAKVAIEIEATQVAQATNDARVLSLEGGISRLQVQMADLQNMRRELTEQQAELLESQRRSERTRTQMLAEWGRRIEGFAHQIEVWSDQLAHFSDQHERNRRVLRETQELTQGIGQQQDRLLQLQKIAEEQLRRDLRQWRGETDRRWAQEAERREKGLEAHSAISDAQDARIVVVEDATEQQESALRSLGDRLDTLRADLAAESQKLTSAQQRAWETLVETFQAVEVEFRSLSESEEG